MAGQKLSQAGMPPGKELYTKSGFHSCEGPDGAPASEAPLHLLGQPGPRTPVWSLLLIFGGSRHARVKHRLLTPDRHSLSQDEGPRKGKLWNQGHSIMYVAFNTGASPRSCLVTGPLSVFARLNLVSLAGRTAPSIPQPPRKQRLATISVPSELKQQ